MCPLFKEIRPAWGLSQWHNKLLSDLSFHFPVRGAFPKWTQTILVMVFYAAGPIAAMTGLDTVASLSCITCSS